MLPGIRHISPLLFLVTILSFFLFTPSRAHAFTVVAHDTFQRTNQTHWGTATDGQAWGSDASTFDIFSIRNNTGQITNTSGNTYSGILGPTLTDAQVLLTGYLDKTYKDCDFGGVIRWNDGANFYKAFIGAGGPPIIPAIGEGPFLILIKEINGKGYQIGNVPFNAVPGTEYSLRFQVIGNQLQAKAWQTNTSEPANWMVSATDSTFASGRVGIRAVNNYNAVTHLTSFTAYDESQPTSTPRPSLYSISGTIFMDNNANGKFDGSEVPYISSPVTVTITGFTNKTITTSSGTYTTTAQLLPGNYTVAFSGLPSGYSMTMPINGPPPSFAVTVGPNCSTGLGNSPDAGCDGNDNITALNFGISNTYSWYQSICSDMRIDTNFSDPIPASPVCGGAAAAPYAITSNATCSNTPGVLYSGNTNAMSNLGQGQASANPYNYTAGDPAYDTTFTPAVSQVMTTSYEYMNTTANESGITPKPLTSYCSGGTLNPCTLQAKLPHGLYRVTGDVYLNPYDFSQTPGKQDYVFLINGNLYIQGNILEPLGTGSTVTFSVKKNIYIDQSVGTTATATTANLQGFFSTDQSFIINTSGTCPDKRLNIEGSVVVNAGLSGGTFQNNRSLCASNAMCPTISFSARPDFLLNAPSFIRHQSATWQETTP